MKSKNTFPALALAMGALFFTACEKEELSVSDLSLKSTEASKSNLAEKKSGYSENPYLPEINTTLYTKLKIVPEPEPHNRYNNGDSKPFRMDKVIVLIPLNKIAPDPEPWKNKP